MSKKKIIIGLLIIILISAFNVCNALFINPKQLRTREEIIKSEKIDSAFDDYIIAYFSDLNYGGVVDDKGLERVISKINDINPDVVIFGGDLIYSLKDGTKTLTDNLKKINAKTKKFAVLGENDNDNVIGILNNADFIILDNENIQLYADNGSFINLVGVSLNGDNAKAFSGITSGYSLAVTHTPDMGANLAMADYVLAGHSLGSRVYIPLWSVFNTIDGAHKYYRGKHNINNTILDITNGVGTKEKSARFLSDAEIVFYKIEAN